MGNCPSTKFPGSNPKKIPSFYYLDRKRQKVYFVEPGKVTSSQFKSSMIFPYDAAITYIQDSCILVAGGTYRGQLISRVTLIDPKNRKVRFLSSLPTPAKEGRLFEYKNWIYFVGAVSKAILHPRSSQEEPAPLMRYDVNKNRWEYFANSKQEELMKRNVQGKSEEDFEEIKALEFHLKHLTLRDILLPGSFMLNEKIYFIGGFIMDNLGRLVQNNQVFSLNLKDNSLEFKVEPFQLPFYVLKPICSSGSKHVIITGGVNPLSGRSNECSCVLTITGSIFKFTPLDVLEVKFYETCCPIYQDYSVFFPRYPIVPVRGKKCKEWKLFDIRKERKKKFIETKGLIKCENELGEIEIPPIKRIKKMIINFDICMHNNEKIESIKKLAENELDEEEIDIEFEESEIDADSEVPSDQLSQISEGIILDKFKEVKKIKRAYSYDSQKSATSPTLPEYFEIIVKNHINKLYGEAEMSENSDDPGSISELSQVSEGIASNKSEMIKAINKRFSQDSYEERSNSKDSIYQEEEEEEEEEENEEEKENEKDEINNLIPLVESVVSYINTRLENPNSSESELESEIDFMAMEIEKTPETNSKSSSTQ